MAENLRDYIADHTDDDVMYRMLAEECMELGQACLKAVRAINDDEFVADSYDDIFLNLLEEKADVDNVFAVFLAKTDYPDAERYMSDISQAKMERWRDRLLYLESIKEKTENDDSSM